MVEVFKTNVTNSLHAKQLAAMIEETFLCHRVTFDLDDCDHILRVEILQGYIPIPSLLNFLKDMGVQAEVLSDEAESIGHQLTHGLADQSSM